MLFLEQQAEQVDEGIFSSTLFLELLLPFSQNTQNRLNIVAGSVQVCLGNTEFFIAAAEDREHVDVGRREPEIMLANSPRSFC